MVYRSSLLACSNGSGRLELQASYRLARLPISAHVTSATIAAQTACSSATNGDVVARRARKCRRSSRVSNT